MPTIEDLTYLDLAIASRRAAGLPDEIDDPSIWREFARAITR